MFVLQRTPLRLPLFRPAQAWDYSPLRVLSFDDLLMQIADVFMQADWDANESTGPEPQPLC